MTVLDKRADLAGPGIGSYEELEKVLPNDYQSLLTPKETQLALYAAKNYIEENLCKEFNLIMVQVPLIVDSQSGVNDYLDRDGSRTPIELPHQQRLRPAPHRRRSCPGGDQMEAHGSAAVRHGARVKGC